MTTSTTAKFFTPAERIALSTDTDTLRHVVRAMESDMLKAMENGVRGTQAHIGMLEMMTAFGREISLRSGV